MKAALIEILEALGYEVYQQGSMTDDYPQSFFTFWNVETDDKNHYNSEAIAYEWNFTVYFYSTDPALVNTVLLAAKKLLKNNGWIVNGKGYDVPADDPNYTGRAITALYRETEDKND